MSFEEMLKKLQEEYIENLPNKISQLEQLIKKMDKKELENLFHKLKGTGKTYGIPEASLLGKVMEKICQDDKDVNKHANISLDLLKKISEKRSQGDSFEIEFNQDYQQLIKAS